MDATPKPRSETCSVVNCDHPARCAGMCNTHYERKRLGRPIDAPVPRWRPKHVRDQAKMKRRGMCRILDCFASSEAHGLCQQHFSERLPQLVEDHFVRGVATGSANECWEWTGSRTKKGYGRIRIGRNGKAVRTHRYALERVLGCDIPDDLVVDHLCHNPPCCNPAHLRVATLSENSLNQEGTIASNTTGYRGIERSKYGRYTARVSVKRKRISLGTFPSAETAAIAVVEFFEREGIVWDSTAPPLASVWDDIGPVT